MDKTFDSAAFDEAAEAAEKELDTICQAATPEVAQGIQTVAKWVKDNYMAAGYKRLGRILLDLAKRA